MLYFMRILLARMLLFTLFLNFFSSFLYITQASPSGDNVLISEVKYDPTSDENAGEWFELYNPTSSTINIGGWTIAEAAS